MPGLGTQTAADTCAGALRCTGVLRLAHCGIWCCPPRTCGALPTATQAFAPRGPRRGEGHTRMHPLARPGLGCTRVAQRPRTTTTTTTTRRSCKSVRIAWASAGNQARLPCIHPAGATRESSSGLSYRAKCGKTILGSFKNKGRGNDTKLRLDVSREVKK